MRRAALLLSALACAAPLPEPLPRVVSVAPSGAVAPDDVAVEVTFSAPIDPKGVEDGRFFALCRRDDLHAVVAAAESEAGIAPGTPVVAARATLAANATRAVLRPAAPLEPDQAWAAVLSYRVRSAEGRPILDAEGKARTIAVMFETGAPVDRVAPRPRWILPPHGPVPANTASLRVGFDEPVAGTLALLSVGPGARAVTAAADVLGLDLATPLAPGTLDLDLGGVRDLTGNAALTLDPLAVSACRAEAPPAVGPDVHATAGPLSVSIEGSIRGMGRLVAEVSASAGDSSCGTAPAAPSTMIVSGDVLACPGWDPCVPAALSCPATVEVKGICPGQGLRARLATEDLAGHRGEFGPWLEVSALPPQPIPVLTEVLADADAPEAGGEYAEVANIGTGDLDLAGDVLAKRSASGRFTRCAITALNGARIAPGAHGVVVGGAYDGRYQLPPGTAVYRCGGSSLDGGLANDRPVALALEDAAGQVLSTAGIAEPPQRCSAGALERIHPRDPDTASNWACPGARTPGACNASTPPAECPRRPW